MSLPFSVTGFLSVAIGLANQAYLTIIAAIWFYAVHYGLSPRYAFLTGISSNSGFILFYRMLFDSVYLNIAALLLIIGSFLLILYNSLGKVIYSSTFLYRCLFAVTLSYFSFRICLLIMDFFLVLFNQVWNTGNLDWYSLFSIDNTVRQIKLSYSENPFFEVMEFLTLSAYFVGTGSLLAVLELRQAIAIFLLLTLPLFSLFFIIRGLDDLAIRFWKLFVEINALPFFILIILYTVHLFPGDFLLQAALIALAASSPYLMVSASTVFWRGASSFAAGGITGLNMESPAGIAGSIKGRMTGGTGKNSSGRDGSPPTSEVMGRAMLKDLEYRRFDGDNNE